MRAAAAALLMVVAGAAPAALPTGTVLAEALPGEHAVELCVAVGELPPSCGPAQALVDPQGGIHLRISDIVYHLDLQPGAVDVVVMHGTMQIDEFLAAGDWAGTRLKFHDRKKNARYDVRFPDGAVRTRRQDAR